jgi:hypothetical protein
MTLYQQIEFISVKVSTGYTYRLVGNVVGYSDPRDKIDKIDKIEIKQIP